MILRYGGFALHKLPITEDNIKSLYYNFDELLEKFIILRDNNFCHADVKSQNILFNPETEKYKFKLNLRYDSWLKVNRSH